ncbi:hypothetical protein Bca101_009627 [Brassica carinata]
MQDHSGLMEEDNIFCWKGTIIGSRYTGLEGSDYRIKEDKIFSLAFFNDYLFKTPKIMFENFCFHPSVDIYDNICFDILQTSQKKCGAVWYGKYPEYRLFISGWILRKMHMEICTRGFHSRHERWKTIVSKSYLKGVGIDWWYVRNIMDESSIWRFLQTYDLHADSSILSTEEEVENDEITREASDNSFLATLLQLCYQTNKR